MSHREPLPFKTVNWLWEELTKVYGHRFLSLWDGLDAMAIKEDWRQRLAGLTWEQLVFGVENLPGGRPPDVIAFRDICNGMPQPERLALPDKRKPGPVPAFIRPAIEHLLQPRPRDGEPYKVVVARRYLARWDGQPHLTLQQQADLKHYRGIVQRWEGGERAEVQEAKARAQKLVEQYQGAQS